MFSNRVISREEAQMEVAKKSLEAKDVRSLQVANEKARQVVRARSTALTTAALRENLRYNIFPSFFGYLSCGSSLGV